MRHSLLLWFSYVTRRLRTFVPSSGVALVLFIMVGLMLSYLTSLQPEDLDGRQ